MYIYPKGIPIAKGVPGGRLKLRCTASNLTFFFYFSFFLLIENCFHLEQNLSLKKKK